MARNSGMSEKTSNRLEDAMAVDKLGLSDREKNQFKQQAIEAIKNSKMKDATKSQLLKEARLPNGGANFNAYLNKMILKEFEQANKDDIEQARQDRQAREAAFRDRVANGTANAETQQQEQPQQEEQVSEQQEQQEQQTRAKTPEEKEHEREVKRARQVLGRKLANLQPDQIKLNDNGNVKRDSLLAALGEDGRQALEVIAKDSLKAEKVSKKQTADIAYALFNQVRDAQRARVEAQVQRGQQTPLDDMLANATFGVVEEENPRRAERREARDSGEADLSGLYDFVDAPEFEGFKDSLRDAPASEIWKRLSVQARARVQAELNRRSTTRGPTGVYDANNPDTENQARVEQAAKDMLDQFSQADFADRSPYVQQQTQTQQQRTPRQNPNPRATRRNDLFQQEAQPLIDQTIPPYKRARNRGIVQGIVGALSFGLGADLAISTFSVIPAAAALGGVLIPVIGMAALGGIGIYTATANAIKAYRYSSLRRHLRRAYLHVNARGVRLSRDMVEKSILKCRKLCNKLGLDYQNATVLNQGLYQYQTRRARVAQAVIKGKNRVKAFGKRMNKKLTLWAEASNDYNRTVKQAKQEYKEILNTEKRANARQNQEIKKANAAIKKYDKLERKYGDAAVHETSKVEAENMIRHANMEKDRAVFTARNARNKYLEEKEQAKQQKETRTAENKTVSLSDRKKMQYFNEFRASMTNEQWAQFVNKPENEKAAEIKNFMNQRRIDNKITNRIRNGVSARRTAQNSNTNSNNNTMARP